MSLTLPAGHSRTLTAVDLEEGAHELDGTLGDGMGKWRLNIRADVDSVAAQSLLYASSGHVSNLSAEGFAATESRADDHGNSLSTATRVSLPSTTSGRIDPFSDYDYFRFAVSETTAVVMETSGGVDTVGSLYDSSGTRLVFDHNSGEGLNFRIRRTLSEGTYYIRVLSWGESTGNYTLHLRVGS